MTRVLLAAVVLASATLAACSGGGVHAGHSGVHAGHSGVHAVHPGLACGPGGDIRPDGRYHHDVIRVSTSPNKTTHVYGVLTAYRHARFAAAYLALTKPGTAPHHGHVISRSTVVRGQVTSPRRLVLRVPPGLRPGHYPVYAVVRGTARCPDASPAGTAETVGRLGRVVIGLSTVRVHLGLFGGPLRPGGGMALRNAPYRNQPIRLTDSSGRIRIARTGANGAVTFLVPAGRYAVGSACGRGPHHAIARPDRTARVSMRCDVP